MWRYLSHFTELNGSIIKNHINAAPLPAEANGALALAVSSELLVMPTGLAPNGFKAVCLNGCNPNKKFLPHLGRNFFQILLSQWGYEDLKNHFTSDCQCK
jgi:hypothetical protein